LQAIERAADAMGGADAIRNATTLTVEGSGATYRLGQSLGPESDLPESKVQSFVRQYDLLNHRMRTEIVSANFLGAMVRQVAALDGTIAFNVPNEGEPQRASAEIVRERQAEYYHHPLPLLQAVLAEGEGSTAAVGALREESGRQVVDITTADGVKLALHLDAQTNLPTMITSTQYNPNLGDVTLSTSFSDWAEVEGVQLPQTISQRIDTYPAADLKVTSTINSTAGDLAAPAPVASAREPAAAVNVTTEELAPGVWYLAGQSHHSVLVEFDEYAALVEAPQNDARTLAVIARARELVPDKPLRYLVNTHHHFDHSGGLRAAVAEGLTIITHEVNRPLYERLVARDHSIVRDRLAEKPATMMLETVRGNEKFELRNGNRVLELYPIQGDTHSDGILMAYLPRERLLVEADVYTPGRGGPTVANLLKNIKERGLRVTRIAPIHGQVVSFAELEKAAMPAPAPATE
jgi:glyoxylase-like metal-dependent hydrolase (beta-lactamase superfamily II)